MAKKIYLETFKGCARSLYFPLLISLTSKLMALRQIYYKTTHTGQDCNFSSQTPWKLKIS